MNNGKDSGSDIGSAGGRNLESLHRSFFRHPDDGSWSATRALAQPSFLKQIDSLAGVHSTPARYFFSRVREQAATPGRSEVPRETSDIPISAPASKLVESGNSGFSC